MTIRFSLLATAAASAMLAGTAAHAAPAKKHVTHRSGGGASNKALMNEVEALKAEVESLKAQVGVQNSAQASTQEAVQSTQAQVQAIQTQVAAAPPVTKEDVSASIADAVDKEHHNDKFYFKGITITPGGFLELAGIYRDHFQGNDISSSFVLNFPNTRQYHQHESRFTARQSRISLLAQGKVNSDVTLSAYGELDFQGAAQTANSNQSNSYNPRIRNLYATIDWAHFDYGLHLLAGQNWSLLTMQSKGITPRAEVTPPQIDAQYIPGFAWARQPGVRFTVDLFNQQLWLAVAAENPQNNTITAANPVSITGTPAAPTTQVGGTTGGSGFNSLNNNSFGNTPDFIAKVAYESKFGDHGIHAEGFGILRKFDQRLITGGARNNDTTGYGYGGSLNVQVIPNLLDAQGSVFYGKGIGRYGSAGLPDVVYSTDGRIHPIKELMLLGGVTLHANRLLDVYAFGGEEQEYRNRFAPAFGSTTNAGCFTEGGACGNATRRIRQITGGFWDKFYQGSFGRAQVGIQYSYTQRQLFEAAGFVGRPQVSNSMAFISFRYYPF